jgi:nucleoside-diphosphate-sugar epimerase
MREVIGRTAEAVVGTGAESGLERLRGKRLLLTGGTGFIGAWLLETVAFLNDQGRPPCRVFVLARDPEAFARKAPHLAARVDFTFLPGDVRNRELTAQLAELHCEYVVHAAASASPLTKAERAVEVGETIVVGTRRVLDLARQWEVESMLFLSSGAVYGTQPPELARVCEEYLGGPHLASACSAYAEAKRYAEVLCVAYQQAYQVPVTIVRPFTFVGPYQDLDAGFAVTDFIRDGLLGRALAIKGDGTTVRSYCGPEDMLRMLWGVLLRGRPGRAYNVGSDEPVSILELAHAVARALEQPAEVTVARQPVPGRLPARYVPDLTRIQTELHLRPRVPLAEVLWQTVTWAATQAAAARVTGA